MECLSFEIQNYKIFYRVKCKNIFEESNLRKSILNYRKNYSHFKSYEDFSKNYFKFDILLIL